MDEMTMPGSSTHVILPKWTASRSYSQYNNTNLGSTGVQVDDGGVIEGRQTITARKRKLDRIRGRNDQMTTRIQDRLCSVTNGSNVNQAQEKLASFDSSRHRFNCIGNEVAGSIGSKFHKPEKHLIASCKGAFVFSDLHVSPSTL